MNKPRMEEKWIVTDDDFPLNVRSEWVMRIPSAFQDDDGWYFLRTSQKAIPQFRVFDTPQAAALAAIEVNERKIANLQSENARLLDWYKSLEANREVSVTTNEAQ